jgi:hypothetical protein
MTTKIKHWWARMSFWNKFRSILTAIGAGTEFALILGEEDGHLYKWVVGGITLLAIIITHAIEDRNNDGIADIFQNEEDLNAKE